MVTKPMGLVKNAQQSATGHMIGDNENERKASSRYLQQNFKKMAQM